MNHLLTNLFATLQKILDYPLFHFHKSDITVAEVLKLLALFVVVILLERVFRRQVVMRFLRRTHLEPALQFALGRIFGYCMLALGFFISIQLVGVDLSSLAILAGGVGVGLGFGLQNVISNFISGLIVLAERPIAIGDRIEIGGIAGQVREISLRSTTVITNDNIAIIVPNENFITKSVTNWSHGDPRVRFRIPFGVAYGTDMQRLRQAVLEIAREHPKALSEPAPEVYFVGFGDSSLNFELGVWTAEMTFAPRRFRSELNFAIEKKLRENGIEMPFPQRDLHLRSGAFVLPKSPGEPPERAKS